MTWARDVWFWTWALSFSWIQTIKLDLSQQKWIILAPTYDHIVDCDAIQCWCMYLSQWCVTIEVTIQKSSVHGVTVHYEQVVEKGERRYISKQVSQSRLQESVHPCFCRQAFWCLFGTNRLLPHHAQSDFTLHADWQFTQHRLIYAVCGIVDIQWSINSWIRAPAQHKTPRWHTIVLVQPLWELLSTCENSSLL